MSLRAHFGRLHAAIPPRHYAAARLFTPHAAFLARHSRLSRSIVFDIFLFHDIDCIELFHTCRHFLYHCHGRISHRSFYSRLVSYIILHTLATLSHSTGLPLLIFISLHCQSRCLRGHTSHVMLSPGMIYSLARLTASKSYIVDMPPAFGLMIDTTTAFSLIFDYLRIVSFRLLFSYFFICNYQRFHSLPYHASRAAHLKKLLHLITPE